MSGPGEFPPPPWIGPDPDGPPLVYIGPDLVAPAPSRQKVSSVAVRERDEARSERDRLAALLAQATDWCDRLRAIMAKAADILHASHDSRHRCRSSRAAGEARRLLQGEDAAPKPRESL